MPRKVVFIMTDTQRFDMLGCYGTPGISTPALDGLASQGVRFDRAYTCTPVCGPARSAIFTGLWPHINGMWSNNLALGKGVKHLGHRLQTLGIHAAYVGKWHLEEMDYFGTGICAEGFDPAYWYEMRNYLDALSPEDRTRSRQQQTNRTDWPLEKTFAHGVSTRATDFLQKHGDEDFCLVVSYDEPHGPYVCPKPFAEMHRDFEFPKRPNVADRFEGTPEHLRVWADDGVTADSKQLRNRWMDFLNCNSFVDSEIGKVLSAIDQFAPDALVIYTSDHGDLMKSHGIINKGSAVFDENARIPFIVRWPGHVPAGAVSPQPVSHIDLVPTILQALGQQEMSPLLQGRSMLDFFCNPMQRHDQSVFIEFGRYEVDQDGFGGFQPIRAAFDGRYKLGINLLTTDELYDVQSDPYELTNLIHSAEHAAIRDGLHDQILDWMSRTRDPFRGYYWHYRPWRENLPKLRWHYTGMARPRLREDGLVPLDYTTGLPATEPPKPL